MTAPRVLFLLVTTFIYAGSCFANGNDIYEQYKSLAGEEAIVFETIVKEFRNEHYEFIGEISTSKKLFMAYAVPFNPLIAKAHEESEEEDHDHEEDEKLNVKMVRASNDDATDLVESFGPVKLTYEELYVVEIADKKLTVQFSTDASKESGRKPGTPNPKILERIAAKLQGTVQGGTITLP
jgi:hypothetical protein